MVRLARYTSANITFAKSLHRARRALRGLGVEERFRDFANAFTLAVIAVTKKPPRPAAGHAQNRLAKGTITIARLYIMK